MEFPEPLVLFHVLALLPAQKLVQKKRREIGRGATLEISPAHRAGFAVSQRHPS